MPEGELPRGRADTQGYPGCQTDTEQQSQPWADETLGHAVSSARRGHPRIPGSEGIGGRDAPPGGIPGTATPPPGLPRPHRHTYPCRRRGPAGAPGLEGTGGRERGREAAGL